MSAEEPGPRRPWVEESRGSKACIDVADGALVTRDLEVKFPDVIFETPDPAGLLCVTVAGLLFTLTDELGELLNKVSNLCRARIRKCRADHPDDGGSEGARVVVSPGQAVQQKLLGGGSDFGGLGCSLRGIDNFFGGGIEVRISGAVSG